MTTIVGVDPGGAFTGLVLRREDQLLGHRLVEKGDRKLGDYALEVSSWIAEWAVQTDRIVGVEGLVHPNPHMTFTNVQGIMDTSWLIGYLSFAMEHWACRMVMVPPSKHGTGPLKVYPSELVGVTEKIGGGKLRHCRSAWDIAWATFVILKQERMARP